MKQKKVLALFLAAAMGLSLVACGSSTDSGSAAQTEGSGEATINVGLVLSTGGLGDKNFNDMAYDGITQAQQDLGITFDYLEPETASDFIPNLRMMAETGEYDLIIGLGADMGESIVEVSEDFPDQKFSHIDSSMDVENISCVQTRWQEQTFLTGVVAGLGTLSDMDKANGDNVVGVILGQANPALNNGVAGFIAGARYVNPDCEVLVGDVDNFNDPAKAKEIALSMYNQGADFIQAIAGASGMGIYNAAKEADRYSFGVGANVNYIEPDFIVATAARKVDEMVYNEIKSVVDGTWSGGAHVTGLAEGAVGFDAEQSNVVLPDDIAAAVEEIRAMVADGSLVLPDANEDMDAWVAANQYGK